MKGIVLFAHGSTVASANDAVHAVTAELGRRTGRAVETAFLDCAPPTVADAVAALVDRGVTEILIVPYFLTTGIHLKRDLPRLVEQIRPVYPDISIAVTEPLDGHPGLMEILVERSQGAVRS
ncbi:MAG TPA: CbiX/SirB N-terminal domain-containing protein [Bryobacteraceae bacterium]|nr:CbiX/SirB N-terminal domain-containing protein [Bryobacteraceae bacterium]